MELRLMWWNADLINGVGSVASQRKKAAAYALIISLIERHDFDVIGLCEVAEDDIKELEDRLGRSGFGVVAAQEKDGQLRFDMCLIYRLAKIACRSLKTIIDSDSGIRMKVAYVIEGAVEQEQMLFVLSHWPSRMQKHDGHNARGYLGDSLRRYVADNAKNGIANIALMGDYNDEPYSDVIFQRLRAVRDQKLVSEENDLLYNPFWRHLVGGTPYTRAAPESRPSGTYYFSDSNYPAQRWWMFDQMIFSRAFVSEGPWHLNEAYTGIIDVSTNIDDWTADSTPGGSKVTDKPFDHLPIFATLDKHH